MIIVPEKRTILLKHKYPQAIVDLIPKARLLSKEVSDKALGHNVAVYHGIEEVKLLNNIGAGVPAPIEYYYDWPGVYKPYAHQRVTSAFLTQNFKAFVLNSMGCVDSETEYLTPSGWKRISEYAGEAVAQYWPETGAIDFVQNPEYVKLPCDTMVRIKTKYGIDQLLSPEHRVLIAAHQKPEKREVLHAAELLARHDHWLAGGSTEKSRTTVGFVNSCIPTTFSAIGGEGVQLTDAQLRVQIAVIADGHFVSKTGTRCSIRLKKERKKLRLRRLLSDAGIQVTELEEPWIGCEGFTRFSFYAPVRTKIFGEAFWQATREQLKVVTSEVMYWDGTMPKHKPTQTFFTVERKSADFIQYAFAATGRIARIQVYPPGRKGVNPCYAVTVRDHGRPVGIAGVATDGTRLKSMWLEPSTDGFKYCFMVPSTFLVLRRNGCIFCTGNTGKGASALWAADHLMREGLVRKVLIVSPLSTLERVWRQEIFQLLMHRVSVVLHGSKQKRLDLLNTDWEFAIINFDGVKIVADEIAKRKDIDLVIVDEASNGYRNAQTLRYKTFKKMLQPWMRLWLMTGTPCPNAPTDAWAMAKLVNPKAVPEYFGTFRRLTMYQATQLKWLPKPEGYKLAFDAMQPGIRFKKSDCLDLPPVTWQKRDCELSDEQKQQYKVMHDHMVAEAKSTTITAVNAADKINKIRQILCGVIKNTDTGEYLELNYKHRLDVLLECIEEAGAKVIVVVPFKGIVESLAIQVGKKYTCAVLNGDVPVAKRNEIIRNFKETPDPHVLLCHPKVMSHGLTLTEADMMIFYAPIYSNDEAQQVVERINRPGQKRNMTIIQMGASKLEWAIYDMVESRKIGQESILSLYKNEIESK